MRLLLHPLPNPSRTRHFRALRAVTAVRAHFPSAFIRVHPRFHHLLRTLRGPSWQITKRTQFSFRVLRVLCGYIHHFVQIRAGSWTEPDQHQIYETNPTRTDPAGRRRQREERPCEEGLVIKARRQTVAVPSARRFLEVRTTMLPRHRSSSWLAD